MTLPTFRPAVDAGLPMQPGPPLDAEAKRADRERASAHAARAHMTLRASAVPYPIHKCSPDALKASDRPSGVRVRCTPRPTGLQLRSVAQVVEAGEWVTRTPLAQRLAAARAAR
jgi:hypothetical protein